MFFLCVYRNGKKVREHLFSDEIIFFFMNIDSEKKLASSFCSDEIVVFSLCV